jgi:GNAT superfamily N-acetyltransferase
MTRSVSAWHLRRARLEDAAEIARLMTELGYPIEAAEILPRLQALLVHPDHLFTVAAGPKDHLSGVIMAEHRALLLFGSQVEIMGLSVGADARRMGVGRALVKAVEDWARQFGSHKIVVRSNVLRPESHPFYEKIGYERKKTQHLYARSLGKHACA